MRRRTRNVILGTLAVLVLLVVFVAGIGALGSGDPYYVTAERTAVGNATDDGGAGGANVTTVNGTDLPARRFPFTTAAIAAAASASDGVGRSDGYRKGPIGIKEAFTHSPFDEMDALRQRNPGARAGDGVLVRRGNVTYRVTVSQEAGGS